MITVRAPKAILAKWDAALRSGNFRQGTGYLEYNGTYCCLGVLQMCVSNKTVPAKDAELADPGWLAKHNIEFIRPPSKFLDDGDAYLPTLRRTASVANDSGMTFVEIANAIKACSEPND